MAVEHMTAQDKEEFDEMLEGVDHRKRAALVTRLGGGEVVSNKA